MVVLTRSLAAEGPRYELGLELDPEHEELASAEIFRDLRLQQSEYPVEPLATGEWE